MKNVVVVGSQWGDEGKGKIVDWLSDQADVVIRFQGGHNAGHTLVIDGITYKLRLLPSGIVRKNKISIIGNGVVVDPWALLEEIEEIRSKGVEVSIDNFIVSESANLILPFHREMDEIREDAAGKGKIGTTRRGIGPAYEDKVGRRSIRVMDLRSETNLDHRLETVLLHHNAIRKVSPKKIFEKYNKIKNINRNKNIVIGFGITEKTIASLKKADGLVVGSALCKEITKSVEKRQNPVTNVTNIVKRLRKKIA